MQPLTVPQQHLLDRLRSGQPLPSQRQLAKELGFSHPTAMNTAFAALALKGYLVVKGDVK